MAIKRSSKVNSSFSSSSMTDLIFLLLVFFVLATTLINPIHALHVSLPTSESNKQADNSAASILIMNDEPNTYTFNNEQVCRGVDELRAALEDYYVSSDAAAKESPVMNVSLHCDRDNTSVQEFVDVAAMIQEVNMAYRGEGNAEDKYKLVLATKESK